APTTGILVGVRDKRPGECPQGGFAKNLSATGGVSIRNFDGRQSGWEIGKYGWSWCAVSGSYPGVSRPNHRHTAHPGPRQTNVAAPKITKERMASDLPPTARPCL